jgi:hypothetical protein
VADIVSHTESSGVNIGAGELPDAVLRRRLASGPQHRLLAVDLAEHPRGVRRNRGLNFDPSHLMWLMIDIEQAIAEFGERTCQ